MGLNISAAQYEAYNQQMLAKYEKYNTAPSQANQEEAMQQEAFYDQGEPDSGIFDSLIGDVGTGNTCTDGADDGKISFFSKVTNVAQGAVRGVTNMVKNAVKHPFKTALMVGACCIPVVGPAIGAGFAAYGLGQGAKQIAESYANAKAIEQAGGSDADVKAAYENIGAGGTTVGLSVIGLKASTSALKTQLKGGSTTVQKLGEVKGQGAAKIAKTAVEEGLKETGSNALKMGKGFIDKAKNAKDGLIETIKDPKGKLESIAESAGKKAENFVDKAKGLKNKAGELKSKASDTKKLLKSDAETTSGLEEFAKENGISEETLKGSKAYKKLEAAETVKNIKAGVSKDCIKELPGGKFEITEGDTVTTYNKNGKLLSQTTVEDGMTTVKKFDSEGNTTYESIKEKIDGKDVTTYEKRTDEYGITSEKIRNGESTYTEQGITTNNKFTGIKKTTNGKTEYYLNGKQIENPTAAQKIKIKAKASNTANKINDWVGDGSISIKGHEILKASPTRYYATTVLLENE